MDNLSIGLFQSNIIWNDAKANCNRFSTLFSTIKNSVDVFVLPEMFNTGFCMNSEMVAESMNGYTVNWMKNEAAKHNVAICGSIAVVDNNCFFNRFLWVNPNGIVFSYDKKHLFSVSGENKHYMSGNSLTTIECNGFRIRPMICYDLRFPSWSMNKFQDDKYDYDVLLYVANWPQTRRKQWIKLLTARAIENQSYVVAVNRVGLDENSWSYCGDSLCLDFLGDYLLEPSSEENVFFVRFEKNKLNSARKNFLVAADWSL